MEAAATPEVEAAAASRVVRARSGNISPGRGRVCRDLDQGGGTETKIMGGITEGEGVRGTGAGIEMVKVIQRGSGTGTLAGIGAR